MRAALWVVVVAGCGHKEATRVPAEPELAHVEVTITNPGERATAIETAIAKPVESALSALPGVVEVRSDSSDGRTVIDVDIKGDPSAATEAVRAAVPVKLLPPTATAPVVAPAPGPIALRYVMYGPFARSLLRDMHDKIVAGALFQNATLGPLDVCGAEPPEWQLHVDPAKLAAIGLSIGDVRTAVAGRFAANEELRNVVVATRNGAPIRIGDVALVENGMRPPACIAYQGDGLPVMETAVHAHPGADIVAPARAALTAATRELPQGMTLEAVAFDREFELQLPGADVVERARAIQHAMPKLASAADHIAVEVGRDHARLLAVAAHDELAAIVAREIPGARAAPAEELDTVEIAGPDLAQLSRLADAVEKAGVDVVTRDGANLALVPEVTPDLARASELGITADEIAVAIRAASGGLSAGSVGGVPITVSVLGHEPAAALAEVVVGSVPLNAIATVSTVPEPDRILHRNLQRIVRLRVRARDPAVLQRALAGVTVPAGYTLQSRHAAQERRATDRRP